MPNQCKCGNPPGGGTSCDDTQLAICRVENGMCFGECHEVPAIPDLNVRRKWCYDVIAKRTFSPRSPSDEEEAVLNQGEYLNPLTGELDHFSLPRNMVRRISDD